MVMTSALAAVAVSDLGNATSFYSTLFGRGPDLEPMPTLAQWDLEHGGVQVVEMPEKSGSSMVTLMVTDFDDFVAQLDSRGIAHGEVVEGVISRVTQSKDPAGNVITFAETSTGT